MRLTSSASRLVSVCGMAACVASVLLVPSAQGQTATSTQASGVTSTPAAALVRARADDARVALPLNAAIRYLAIFPHLTSDATISGLDWDAVGTNIDAAKMPAEFVAAFKLVDRSQIDELRRAAAIEHCDFENHFEDGWAMLLPSLGKFRQSVRLLRVDTRRALTEGDTERATENLVAAFRMVHHAVRDPILICSLVGAAMSEYMQKEVQTFINAPGVTLEQRARVADAMRALGDDPFGVRAGIRGEQAISVGWLRYQLRTMDDTRREKLFGELGTLGSLDPQSPEYAILMNLGRDELLAMVDAFEPMYQEASAAWDQPDGEDKLRDIGLKIESGGYGLFARVFAPALNKVYRSGHLSELHLTQMIADLDPRPAKDVATKKIAAKAGDVFVDATRERITKALSAAKPRDLFDEVAPAWAVRPEHRNAAIMYLSSWLSSRDVQTLASCADLDDKGNDPMGEILERDKLPESVRSALPIAPMEGDVLAATRLATCDFQIDFERGYKATIPGLSNMRTAARVLRLQARGALIDLNTEGNAEHAAQNIAGMYRVARDAAGQRTAISSLVAQRVIDLATRETRLFLKTAAATPERAAMLRDAIRELGPDPLRRADVLNTEETMLTRFLLEHAAKADPGASLAQAMIDLGNPPESEIVKAARAATKAELERQSARAASIFASVRQQWATPVAERSGPTPEESVLRADTKSVLSVLLPAFGTFDAKCIKAETALGAITRELDALAARAQPDSGAANDQLGTQRPAREE
ncbi:MAG: hypothetical protein SFY96_11060 [Planctomycetota bacterium]|nr:hypothetical protein [Planctomycetota bacterium]